jgi:hypothetical protein
LTFVLTHHAYPALFAWQKPFVLLLLLLLLQVVWRCRGSAA